MASATAFFCLFALPPIVIILSQLYSGLFDVQNQGVSLQLFDKLADLFGDPSARQLQDISQHLQQRRSTPLVTSVSVLLLFLAATTLFTIIKNSLNQLWRVKPTANQPLWHSFLDRVLALGVILFSGFLVAVSILTHRAFLPPGAEKAWFNHTVDHVLSVLLLTSWFALVFKYLPDIRIHWRAVWVGGLITALLVEAGDYLLNQVFLTRPMSSVFGTAGSLILILLFVFYVSLIFYYGASFTRCYTHWMHLNVEPGQHAVAYEIKELDDPPNTDKARDPI